MVGDIIDGAFQHGKFAFSRLTVLIAKRIVDWMVRHVVFFRVVVLVGKDGLAVRNGIEIGVKVELVA